ncbi:MAG: cation diffusion facilitator family transporter [Firmicutes bacterium]|nr:cation diffusion facilitator family transporter [Bacillota bacterium]
MDKTKRAEYELSTLKLTIILYGFAFAVKITGYYLTGIMVLLADALHSLSDLFVYSFLLIAMIWSRKKADEVHMFGYGRAQNVGALVAATIFIAVTSYKLVEEAVPRLIGPVADITPNYNIAFVVIGISLLIPVVPIIRLLGQKSRGAAAKAHFIELFNDELSTLAALAGTLFLLWGYPRVDPIASLAVAGLVAFNGVRLFKENSSFLIGRSPGPQFLEEVEKLARSVEGVLGIHDLRAEYVGPEIIHTDMHIEVPRGITIEEADRIAEEVRDLIHKNTGCRYCGIHIDPADAVDN